VAPTPAGTALLARLEPAVREIGEALDEAGQAGQTISGTVRINAPSPATQLVLAPLITRFLERHPRVSLDIVSESGFVDIVAAGFDAGVRYGEALAQDMIALPLGGKQRMCIVGAPDLIARVGTPQTPQDLLRLPCIRMRYSTGTVSAWEFERAGQAVVVRPEGPLVTTDSVLAIAAARDGLGFTLTFEGWVRHDIEAGRLVSVLEDWLPPFDGPYLYYPSRRHMPAALRAFIAFLREEGRA
jgi:DNA-binding transcriptional LysR family regulator